MRHNRQSERSGQILMLAVLVICLVLLSTQLYVYDVGRPLENPKSFRMNDFVMAVRLGSQHAVIGALANVSVGGEYSILATNLERWATLLGRLYQFGRPILNFTLRGTAPYTNGTYLMWLSDGSGVSSTYSDFVLSISDRQIEVSSPFTINVTTSLAAKGVYLPLQGNMKQINITCHLLNEGEPALAQNLTMLYEDSGSWIRANGQSNYQVLDYGNGTYVTSFEADISQDDVNVSAQVHDLRGIYVQANVTCTIAS